MNTEEKLAQLICLCQENQRRLAVELLDIWLISASLTGETKGLQSIVEDRTIVKDTQTPKNQHE